MPQLLLVDGPNLNLLGAREPALNRRETLDDVVDLTASTPAEFGVTVGAQTSAGAAETKQK